jgi:hypothetical protein
MAIAAAALPTLAIAEGFMVLAEERQGVQPGDLAEYLALEACRAERKHAPSPAHGFTAAVAA